MKVSIIVERIILVIILSVIVADGQQNLSRPKTQEEILSLQIYFPSARNNAPSFFQASMLNAKLPGGVIISNCGPSENKSMSLMGRTSIGEILKYIETTDPNYHWEFSGGVLNLLQRNNVSELLEMPIDEFKAENVTVDEALNILMTKTEVKEKIIKVGLGQAVSRINILEAYDPVNGSKNIPRFKFDIRAATLRGILNEIIKKDGRRTWFYIERHCGEQTEFSVYLAG